MGKRQTRPGGKQPLQIFSSHPSAPPPSVLSLPTPPRRSSGTGAMHTRHATNDKPRCERGLRYQFLVPAGRYVFLTTEPNAEVRAIHPKAIPVILTTPQEVETWMTAPPDEAF